MTGDTFSHQRKKGEPMFDVLQIGIEVPREVLYDRINTRVDQMMAAGLLEEVRGLMKQKYGWNLPSMQGIGYRQFKDCLMSDQGDVAAAVERLKNETRQFAKRQLTWFKRDPRIVWCSTYEEIEKRVADFLRG